MTDNNNNKWNPLRPTRYNVIASPPFVDMAEQMQQLQPDKFRFFPSKWEKFADSDMDKIEIGGFSPDNHMRNSNVIFLASFHDNDAILTQLQAMIMMLESFIHSLVVVLPFFPTGTMERVSREGQVATANTIARLFSNLPNCGSPTRVMIYDIHALQNRFYLYGNALASLHSTIPLLLQRIGAPGEKIDAIAFPDDGAHKRFQEFFSAFPQIVCSKVRIEDKRHVRVHEGDPTNCRVLVVDDLVRSGGTLFECAKCLKEAGAVTVSAFCAHAAFKEPSWREFARGGAKDVFEFFFLTNSVPLTTNALSNIEPFVVLDLLPQILLDL